MIFVRKLALGVFIWLAYSCADAADFSIKVEKFATITPPGSTGNLSVTITNNGGVTDLGFFRVSTVLPRGSLPLSQPISYQIVLGPCGISPVAQSGPGDTFGLWITKELLPGESATCHWQFVVDQMPYADEVTVKWAVMPYRLMPVPAEESFDSVVFKFYSETGIPTTGPPFQFLMVLMLLLTGVFKLANRAHFAFIK